MRRVRLRDAGPVSWTLASAFTTTRTQAVLTTPAWWLIVLAERDLFHHDHRVVVALERRGARPPLRVVLRLIALMTAIVTAGVVIEILLAAAGLTVSLAAITGALVLVPLLPGLAVMALRPGTPVSVRLRQRQPDTDYVVSYLASRQSAGGLLQAAAHLRTLVGDQHSIGTRAASPKLARIYQRFGFIPDPDDPLLMTRQAAPVPAAAPIPPAAPPD